MRFGLPSERARLIACDGPQTIANRSIVAAKILDLLFANELDVPQTAGDVLSDIALAQRWIGIEQHGNFVRDTALIVDRRIDRFVFVRS